ncbi:mannitol-1-phosphate 5-dehydrogenase [Frigoribacterium sp. CFBP 8754]|uniref:mannitol-1-phosphate 5-dehydrogenase n=1 Tax=unclassified Frigoribacterium TaxID=2627005 RepID=UPI0006F37F1A|nr:MULTISPECIES: mannitol-1-phosphate 5-dehydrogenase [unclassified Frigoribacterium]KQR47290.1 mannitol-1-phosphate 5-dehydrogenase [Frigoribacterium sp. Leaf164]MBD8659060.1 mannitol-1-phosphate 5-dehydrogenase [Frigoribacterium sp. CFBP 8754]MBD8727355.1 mannitol-1-phosphate 5-dehydrogenase [Frigoribacterium sp. CFBP 13707]
MSKKAVHFGAGNIGRGFVAQFLHASGYEVVFADVNDELIGLLQSQSSYEVHEVGEDSRTTVVDGYRAVNSRSDEEALVAEIATADVVTTAVGARILPFVAPVIARGLAQRDAALPPLTVIACENAINATDSLAEAVRQADPADNAVFANCAIDRIVPEQPAGSLDVTIESFSEWVVESGPFGEHRPEIQGVTWVPDLEPFIERKLFTVNTAHAAAAYHGFARGLGSIRESLADEAVHAEVRAALAETKALLVAKHELDADEQQSYIEKNLVRISNPHLPDTTERVGRNPLRKLSRHERFVGPAAQLAERGLPSDALVRAVRAALDFDVADDAESVELQALLRSGLPADELTVTLTGVEAGHPLSAALVEAVSSKLPA